jgi:hypothetical protein
VGGCQTQEVQNQWTYTIKPTGMGYLVVITGREHYTFKDDLEVVLRDKRFVEHIIFWSSACAYLFATVPTRDPPDYLLVPLDVLSGVTP